MSAFISSSTAVAMIDARTQSGAVLLPRTTDLLNRVVTFKDIFGAVARSTVMISTTGGDFFEDGTNMRVFNTAYQSIQVYAGRPGFWYTIGGSSQLTMNTSALVATTISAGTTLLSSLTVGPVGSIFSPGATASITRKINNLAVDRTILDIGGSDRELGNFNNIWKYRLAFSNQNTGTGGNFNILALPVASNTYNSDGAELLRVTITSAGNLGILCNAPAFALDVNGTAHKQDNLTTWNQVSDARIKQNITLADIDVCYSNVKQLPLRRYEFISSFYEQNQKFDNRRIGFIAQEVSTLFPKAITSVSSMGYDDLLTFNFDQINYSMYGALQKVIGENEAMQSTILGQALRIQTLSGTSFSILSTLEGLQGR